LMGWLPCVAMATARGGGVGSVRRQLDVQPASGPRRHGSGLHRTSRAPAGRLRGPTTAGGRLSDGWTGRQGARHYPCLLYTSFNLLAGRPPFLADSLPELFAAVLGTPPPPLAALRAEVPAGLCDVVDRCLAKDPAARCPSVVALARAIAPYGSESGRASAARIASASSALPATSASSVALGDALEPSASLATSHRTCLLYTSLFGERQRLVGIPQFAKCQIARSGL